MEMAINENIQSLLFLRVLVYPNTANFYPKMVKMQI
ncbi:hypothetical protein BDGGKGIB_00560 [Nodularia sphaerocarpa UHCC 0038]|nr:hypothetical protein BDGGKGIB_00560 [Nodularia sphaerocarpa UHCC 0038]